MKEKVLQVLDSGRFTKGPRVKVTYSVYLVHLHKAFI